jgi:hypothetical protein
MLASEFIDRMAILVAVRRFLGMGIADSRSLRYESYVRMHHFVRRSTYLFLHTFFAGDVRRKFMQRLSTALHDTLGSSLRDVLHDEGNVDALACLHDFPSLPILVQIPPL